MPGQRMIRPLAQILGAGLLAGIVSFAAGFILLPLGLWGGASTLSLVFAGALIAGCAAFVLLCGMRSGVLAGLWYGTGALAVVLFSISASPTGGGIARGDLSSGPTLILFVLTLAIPVATGFAVGGMRSWLAKSLWENAAVGPWPWGETVAGATVAGAAAREKTSSASGQIPLSNRSHGLPGIPDLEFPPQLSGSVARTVYFSGQDPTDFE